jgi:hypothetical protein
MIGEFSSFLNRGILYMSTHGINRVPSGKLTVCELENHHAINGKINDFYGYFQ